MGDGSLTRESAARVIHPPILLILMEENKVLYGLFDEEFRTNRYAIMRDGESVDCRWPSGWNFMLIVNDVYKSVTDDMLVGVMSDYIDRHGSVTGLTMLPLRR